MDPLADEDMGTPADEAYKWLIRALYVGLVAGNLLWLYSEWSNTADGLALRGRVKAWLDKAKNCEGCARRKEAIRRATGHMLWEAQEIVEQAAQEGKPDE